MRTLFVLSIILVLAIAYFLVVPSWPDQVADAWVAAGTLATVVTTAVALAGLIGVTLLRNEARRARQQMRAEIGPYLRIDLYTEFDGGTFSPPIDSAPRYDWAAFNPGPRPDSHIDPWILPSGVPILLRVGNQQEHRAGVAHSVSIDVELQVPVRGDSSDNEPLQHVETVTFHYVEPGKAVIYEIARLDSSIPFVTGRVQSIIYFDLFNRPLHFGHGSGAFEVETAGGVHVNSRRVFYEEVEIF